MWLSALIKVSTERDGNRKEALTLLRGIVVEVGRFLEGVKAKMSS